MQILLEELAPAVAGHRKSLAQSRALEATTLALEEGEDVVSMHRDTPSASDAGEKTMMSCGLATLRGYCDFQSPFNTYLDELLSRSPTPAETEEVQQLPPLVVVESIFSNDSDNIESAESQSQPNHDQTTQANELEKAAKKQSAKHKAKGSNDLDDDEATSDRKGAASTSPPPTSAPTEVARSTEVVDAGVARPLPARPTPAGLLVERKFTADICGGCRLNGVLHVFEDGRIPMEGFIFYLHGRFSREFPNQAWLPEWLHFVVGALKVTPPQAMLSPPEDLLGEMGEIVWQETLKMLQEAASTPA